MSLPESTVDLQRPLRVLMLSTDLQRGGLPLRLVNLARAIREYGIEPIVGSLAPRGPLHDLLDEWRIASFHCDAAGQRSLGALRTLSNVIRREDPDLIHASLFHANVAARLVGTVDRSRPVITSSVTVEIERLWHNFVELMTSYRSTLHVANSTAVRHHLLRLGFDEALVVVIPNGIDVDRISSTTPIDRELNGLSNGRPLFLWVGRMDPVKNLDTLIEIAKRCRCINAQWILIGDGPQREIIQTNVDKLGLRDSVRLIGWRKDVSAWLRAADALVFPSLTEGAPNAVLEAMAAGCPVVASRIPAHECLIENGGNGILCTAKSVDEYVAGLKKLTEDLEFRKRMSEAGLSRVRERHEIKNIARRWARQYRELLSAKVV